MSTSTLSDTGLGRTDLGGLRIAIANWRDPWYPQAGGAERYAWEMARALAAAGAAVRKQATPMERLTGASQP
jgi:hypothetical protein